MLQSLPLAVAFTNILYEDPIYKPDINSLFRLMLGSNAVQQLVVTLLSSVTVIVGQVQDIGLIFLNVMTRDIANEMKDQPREQIVGTAVLATCCTMVLLGATLLCVSRCVPVATTPPCSGFSAAPRNASGQAATEAHNAPHCTHKV